MAWRTESRSTAGPPVFVHRDYHAQNLLWRGALPGLARVGIIDFQDAVAGSPAYDVISLLEDARRDVSPELGEAMMSRYLERSPLHEWRGGPGAFPRQCRRIGGAAQRQDHRNFRAACET